MNDRSSQPLRPLPALSEPDYQAFLASLKELEESLKDPAPAPVVLPDSPETISSVPPTTSLVAHILKCRAKGKSSAKAGGELPKAKVAKKILVAKMGDQPGGGGPLGRAKVRTGALPSGEEEAAGQKTTPLKAASSRKAVPGKNILGHSKPPVANSAPPEFKPTPQPKILARKDADGALAKGEERLPSAPRTLPVALDREPEAGEAASPRPAFERKGNKQRLKDKKPLKAAAASATAAKPEAASPSKRPVKLAGKGRAKVQERPEAASLKPAPTASLKPATVPAEAAAAPPVPKILARPKPLSTPGPLVAAEPPPASPGRAPKLGKGAKGKGPRAEVPAAVPAPRASAPKFAHKGVPSERQAESGAGGEDRPLTVAGPHPLKPRFKKVFAEGEAGERPTKPKFVPRSRN
ncbi:hypothetical protein H632_c1700p1 [Helicosporidium sp. ATCC 50920]|nr:hypothetical protein H632_c1700p1 [Helicosporidium sp. ATCC 50920]|eukprot:KDD73955.1 hypothetical protein H632_c1700p1 [Helicosporidium sp. ATCC 50920]